MKKLSLMVAAVAAAGLFEFAFATGGQAGSHTNMVTYQKGLTDTIPGKKRKTTPTPTPAPMPTPTPAPTPNPTPNPVPSPNPSPNPMPSPTPTPTPNPTPSTPPHQ